MNENAQLDPNRKKTMKKVRPQFLNRSPDEIEPSISDPLPTSDPISCSDEDVRIINAAIGLIESKGKVRLATHFLNTCYNVSSIRVDEHQKTRAVTLNLEMKQDKVPESWESIVNRLEKTEDIELLKWAGTIRKHHTEYPKIIKKYFELLKSEDPEIRGNLRRAQAKARLACRELESQYDYFKVSLFLHRDALIPLSVTYTKKVLAGLGHTIEEFVPYAKIHGLPILSSGETSTLLDINREFLEGFPLSKGPVQDGPEFDSVLFNKDLGYNRMVRVKFIGVVEPATDGIFMTGFYLQKEADFSFKVSPEDEVRFIPPHEFLVKTVFPKKEEFKLDTDDDRYFEEPRKSLKLKK